MHDTRNMTIGFIGNPNSGKTTLFNAYTGAHLKVANWPGVTVEKKEGAMRAHDREYRLVDLPGTYSLTSYTMEEIVSRNYILSGDVDVLIDVVDASCLERSLYLTLQLIELGLPVVLALNMMDIVEKRGMEIDTHRLPELLGIATIPVSARRRKGLDILIHAAAHHGEDAQEQRLPTYSEEIEERIAALLAELNARYPELSNPRWHAIKLLEKDPAVWEATPVPEALVPRSYETEITNQKYDLIERILDEVLVNRRKMAEATDRADAVLTHRVLGLPIFLGIMGLIFFLTFTVGDWLAGYFTVGIDAVSGLVADGLMNLGVHEAVRSLVVDGILAGVGGVLTFLPNIFILFFLLSFLEDSGYMARVAYVMDGIMGRMGVSGRAFLPLLLGFGCTVPAVMATRALESTKDRLRVMLVIPFMSCSAKLPVYVLFAGLFFPDDAVPVAYSMYLIGMAVALLTAWIAHRADKKSEANHLLIELPEYKAPSAHNVLLYVWEKIRDYLSRAGTVILLASVILWVVLHFGFDGFAGDISQSFGASLGRLLVPLLAPIGLGFWQVAVSLIAGLSAKEVVVASFAVLFGIPNLTSPDGAAALVPRLADLGFAAPNAFALMTFCLLYPPCVAALAAIRREAGSWRWVAATAALQIGVAWAVSFAAYRIGLLLV